MCQKEREGEGGREGGREREREKELTKMYDETSLVPAAVRQSRDGRSTLKEKRGVCVCVCVSERERERERARARERKRHVV